MFDEFLNKHFFKFRSIMQNQKRLEDKILILKSGRFNEFILEAIDRISQYIKACVLQDMKNSAIDLLNIIENNVYK